MNIFEQCVQNTKQVMSEEEVSLKKNRLAAIAELDAKLLGASKSGFSQYTNYYRNGDNFNPVTPDLYGYLVDYFEKLGFDVECIDTPTECWIRVSWG